jgi:hypothetical protein
MVSARLRTYQIHIENVKHNPYSLKIRAQPFSGVLLRDKKRVSLDGIVGSDLRAQDGDVVVIRIPSAAGAVSEWPAFEQDLFDFYESIDILRLSSWEREVLEGLVRKSAAILVARTICVPVYEIPSHISSIEQSTGQTTFVSSFD